MPQTLYEKAIESYRSGQVNEAEELYKQVLQAQPDHILAHALLGYLFEEQNRFPEAIQAYQTALNLNPDPQIAAQTLFNLGNIFKTQGQLKQAIEAYQKSLELEPDRAIAQFNLGNVFCELGKFDHAVQAYQAAVKVKPDLTTAHLNLATLLQKQGNLAEAEQACRKLLEITPRGDKALTVLGNILQHKGQFAEATQTYRQAIEANPDNAEAYYNLGNTLYEQYDSAGAQVAFQKALEISPGLSEARMGLCFSCLPIIYSSADEVLFIRDVYQSKLEALAAYFRNLTSEEQAAAAEGVGALQPFFLAYQGFSDRALQQTFGAMVSQLMACRYPQWSQAIPLPTLGAEDKIRVGFVSRFFYEHSNWKIPIRGWLENLDRSEFELFGYHTISTKDQETVKASKLLDKFYQGPLTIQQWAETIRQDNPHILIFPEFGMDPVTLQLGCLRLAPIQATSWGHPNTSGLPHIDYYLSSDLMEPDDAQSHYTEQLIRLPNLSIHYTPLEVKPKPVQRETIGIEPDTVMYWCCQSLYKYLPQYDDVFPKIAQEVNAARFVFIKHFSEQITQVFQQRLHKAFENFGLDDRKHCIFLDRMDTDTFSGTASVADVFLDSVGWSGCNSTLESIAHNVPVVTLAGDLMRGRHSMAILKMMGIEEAIADSKEEYVRLAIRVGEDAQYRRALSQQIAENKHKLYGDLTPVRALEDLFCKLVNKPRRADAAEIAQAFHQAKQFQQTRQLEEAIQIYRALLQKYPEQPEVLLELGLLLQQMGQFLESEQCLSQSAQNQPGSVKTWFALGNLHLSQGHFLGAIESYRKALELRPDAVSLYNNLGYAHQQQEEWDQAIDCYEKALELQPNCVEAEANLGNALHASGKLKTHQCSHYADLNLKLGEAQYLKGNRDVALAYFRQAVKLQPDLAKAQLVLGIYLRDEEGNLEEALTCFKQAQAANPTWKDVYAELGKTYQNQLRLSEAVDAFREYVRLVNPVYAKLVAEAVDGATETSLEQYNLTPIAFQEVTVGDYCFPVIPPVQQSETKRPFWSVVIPAVNRPEYFPECLASVLAQWTGDEEMEIVVLDNGSNPPLFDIVNALGKGIIRYYRFPKTIPLQENWNTVVALSRGHWVFLLHHDDYVLPGFFSQFRNSLETCPASVGAAFTDYQNIDEYRKVVFVQDYGLSEYRGIVKDWVERIGSLCLLSPPSVVIRRTVYEHLGGYKLDLPYTCDWEFYKRVACFYDWWHEPGVMAHYRQYSNSLTQQGSLNGVAGMAHRLAIEISHTYLPGDRRDKISQNSRKFHFKWCMERAAFATVHQAALGAMKLAQEALLIDTSEEAAKTFLIWIDIHEFKLLKQELSLRLFEHETLDEGSWTLETIEMIRRLKL